MPSLARCCACGGACGEVACGARAGLLRAGGTRTCTSVRPRCRRTGCRRCAPCALAPGPGGARRWGQRPGSCVLGGAVRRGAPCTPRGASRGAVPWAVPGRRPVAVGPLTDTAALASRSAGLARGGASGVCLTHAEARVIWCGAGVDVLSCCLLTGADVSCVPLPVGLSLSLVSQSVSRTRSRV